MRRILVRSALSLISLCGLANAQATIPIFPAHTHYTIDVTNKWLCKVNVDTGAITYVAPTTNWAEPAYFDGYDSQTTSYLAYHQGYLHAVTRWRVGWPHKVAIVVPYGPQAGHQVNNMFFAVNYASDWLGGYDSDGTKIAVAWAPVSNHADRYSTLWPTSTLGNPVPLGMYDARGIGFFGGALYAVGKSTVSDLGYSLMANPAPPLGLVGSESLGPSTHMPLDTADHSAQKFVAMSESGNCVIHISKSTGLRLAVVPVSGAMQNAVFRGIALVPARSYREWDTRTIDK